MLLAAIGAAHAQSLKSQIESHHKKIGAAMMKKDTEEVGKLFKSGFTKDFKYFETAKSQPHGADQMINSMKMGLGAMKKMKAANSKILSLKENGNKATVSTQHTMVGTMDMGDNKEHVMSFTGVSDDVYVKVNGKWLMSKMTWKSQKMTMDGKPMPTGGG